MLLSAVAENMPVILAGVVVAGLLNIAGVAPVGVPNRLTPAVVAFGVAKILLLTGV